MKAMSRLNGKRRLAIAGSALTLGALSWAVFARADTVIVNDVSTGSSAGAENISKTVGDSGTAIVYMNQTLAGVDGDTRNGCNADAANPVVFNVVSDNTSAVTVNSPGQVSISDCGFANLKSIAYQAVGAGTAHLSAVYVSGGKPAAGATPSAQTAAAYNVANVLTVTVTAAADTTPPVITPNVSGTLGNNGWYTSNVTVSWTVSDPESSVSSSSGCGTTTINTDTTGQTLTCTATSAGGTSSNSVTIKRDATAPTGVATALNRPPDHDGWYNAPVAWTTTGTDATSLIASCSSGTYSGPDGTGLTVSGTCTDNAGNTSAPPASSAGFSYDNTDPIASVSGVENGQTYIRGSVPPTGCDEEDNLSGVQTAASLTMSGPGTTNPNGVGSFTATCSGAKDNADNSQAAPVSASYSVIYDPAGISGILQPINPDGTSLFGRGKAVPVKFRLAGDEPNGFSYSGWTLQRIKISCTDFDSEDAAIEAATENPSNAFRYDGGADQYINNASFKDQAAGTCWKVRVTLDSNQTMESAVFKLQK
jgi:hypothetical protein